MSLTEDNWQTIRPTIRERTKFVFNNDRLSDIKFVVRKMDGESESKQVIPAHKLVLSISSPVFEAMFYGELPETKHSIELPDCEYESLLELFRYIYSDEVALNGSNVMRVLYLAKKYMVPSLAQECSKCPLLHAISFFGNENQTYPVTLEVIDNTSKSVLATKTTSFPSELLQCEKCSYQGFEVYFDQQINIKRNTSYAISALISGPSTCQGIGGVGSIQCAGVTFTFTK